MITETCKQSLLPKHKSPRWKPNCKPLVQQTWNAFATLPRWRHMSDKLTVLFELRHARRCSQMRFGKKIHRWFQLSFPKDILLIFSMLVFMAVLNTSSSLLHLKHGALYSKYMSFRIEWLFLRWKMLDVALLAGVFHVVKHFSFWS